MVQKRKLTILVAPVNAVGHVNACAGTTKPLVDRGHRVVFMLDPNFKGTVAPLGFEEHIYKLEVDNWTQEGPDVKPGQDWSQALLVRSFFAEETLEKRWDKVLDILLESPESQHLAKQMNTRVGEAMHTFKPDLIVLDNVYLLPVVAHSGTPWILNLSITPQTYCDDEGVPPGCSGLPTDSPRDETWQCWRRLHHRFYYNKKYNDLLQSMGYPRYPKDQIMPSEQSLLTVFAYPEELNYPDIRRKQHWFNLEVFNRPKSSDAGFSVAKLVGDSFARDTLDGRWTGKWVYVSMGTIGSVDLGLMRQLLAALATTDHKYIVSKGPRHDEYGLPRNAWGDRYLPQMQLVPHMDAIVTHGGNNTVTETFALGKPMVVLPLYGDQNDNAQRVHETGFGVRLDPYNFTSEQLVHAVDRLVGDAQLHHKMAVASKRILASDRHQQLCDLIEAKMSALK